MLSLPTEECDFWGHEMHTFLVLFEYDPAKQSVHVLLVKFKATENFPAAQSEHAPDPALVLYLPAMQPVQLPCVPDQPALHVQLVLLTAEYVFRGHITHCMLTLPLATKSENFPASQSVHVESQDSALYLPSTQTAHKLFIPDQPALHMHSVIELLINADYEPVGHSRHCDLFSAEYEPATQPVHGADPGVAVCLPATQLVQLTFAPVHPASHKQAVIVVLPTGETEFAGQPTQPECPVPTLYVPAAHPTHGPPFAQFHPALQMQSAVIVLALGKKEFAGQSTQPLEPKYVPERHWQLGTLPKAAHQSALKP